MLIRIYIYISLSILLFFSCSKEMENNELNGHENVITASIEGGQTKTVLSTPIDGIYKNYWSVTDTLALCYDNVNNPNRFTLTAGEGKTTGSFIGLAKGDKYVALYPYSAFRSLDGTSLTINLPDKQKYVKNSFGPDSYPMVAVGTTNDLQFKNLCSVLKLSMKGTQIVTSIVVKSNSSSAPVSGDAVVKTDFTSVPTLKMNSGDSQEVTLECGKVALNAVTAQNFFIVLPAQEYKGGFIITIYTTTGYMVRKISSDITMGRSELRAVKEFVCKLDSGINPSSALDGKGIASAPFLIKSLQDLLLVQSSVNSETGIIASSDGTTTNTACIAYYKLMADIDLGPVGEWIPIGTTILNNTFYFGGDFNGNHHLIKNLYINTTSDKQGLFGQTTNGVKVYDLSLSGEVKGGTDVGLLVGKSNGDGLFSNITVSGSVSGFYEVGGIAGSCKDITNSTNNCKVSGYYSGGIAGWAIDGKIINCTNTGKISGYNNVGGICGLLDKSIIYNCINNADILATDQNVGGISGEIKGGYSKAIIVNCINSGNVTSSKSDRKGGITCGTLTNYIITNCYHIYDPAASLGMEQGVYNPEGTVTDVYGLSAAVMKGTSAANSVLYTSKGGKKYSKLINALNSWAADNTTQEMSLYGWKFASSGSYPSFTGQQAVQPSEDENNGDAFTLSKTSFDVPISGGSISVTVTSSLSYSVSSKPDWITETTPVSTRANTVKTHTFSVASNNGAEARTGAIVFCNSKNECVPVTVKQAGFTYDGVVTQIGKSTVGNGINIIITGDGFMDNSTDMNKFDSYATKAMNAIFAEEPFKSFKNRFNVYSIKAVSSTNTIGSGTRFGTYYGSGTYIGGNNEAVFNFITSAFTNVNLDKTLIVTLLNDTKYAGTCHMYSDNSVVAYVPLTSGDDTFAKIVKHEAGGHGFGKLDDEYVNYQSTIPQSEIDKYNQWKNFAYGFNENVDITNNPASIKWAGFLTDTKYSGLIGIYEGAMLYKSGAYRATENSIMNANTGGYNAPSREAIYKKIMKFSEGGSWTYNYDTFVAIDAVNRSPQAVIREKSAIFDAVSLVPLAPPVRIIKK